MKVLFISSGNKKNGISVVIENQGRSLQKSGITVDFFSIEGKGFLGYAGNIRRLSKTLKKGNYDILHAHYSLSGFLVTLSSPFKGKIVVSLMGTLRKATVKYYLVRFLARVRWKAVIVKSERMKSQIGIQKAYLIPNGVEMELFDKQPSRDELRNMFGFKKNIKYILFASDPKRPEKNFKLCEDAVRNYNGDAVELCVLSGLPHEKVVQYMLAADVLMLTSLTEGSPNVIKEAMTANCPVVSTDVGDVKFLLGNTAGCFLMESFERQEAAEKLKAAIEFGKRTTGRDRILSLSLDDRSIADRIISVYNS